MIKRPEVLSPAGDRERLEAALDFGADAVYLGAKEFGMRQSPSNFTFDELKSAVTLAHTKGVSVYITVNSILHSDELDRLPEFLRETDKCGVDAYIAADIGVIKIIRETLPCASLHVSTQTGVVNYRTALELYSMGASRIVLARELSLDEIKTIRDRTPSELEIECFVHGAMCVSFSGRCLISDYMTGRDANHGECAQPCRWNYALCEEKRPGQYFPISENETGTYILNSKDLCMIEHVKEMCDAGIDSFKIEGRAKSAYYVSSVTAAYRAAVDNFLCGGNETWFLDEVCKVSHRAYSTGFYYSHKGPGEYYENAGYIRDWDVVAIVESCSDGYINAVQRNRFFTGDTVELLSPGEKPVILENVQLSDENDVPIDAARHAQMKLKIRCEHKFTKNTIIRKKV